MKALMFAHDSLACGDKDIVIAGGIENMSQAPYLLLKGRAGLSLRS